MSARDGSPDATDHVELVGLDDSVDARAAEDGLDLGAPPRPPASRRTKRLLAAGAVVVAAAAVAVVLVVRPGGDGAAPAPRAAASGTPFVESSAGFAAGPVLVTVGGRDALQAPGLPGLGASVDPVVLESAPAEVAVVASALPGFRDVRGGRIPADVGGVNGLYLAGDYDGADGSTVSVTLYTVRAPGTTFGTDQYVSRTRFDRVYNVRTDVSVFTGSGWWVHVVTLGPDDPAALRTGEVSRLLPLARDPRLVAT